MNFGMILSKAANAVKSFAGNGWLLAKKRAPELMIVTGIGGFGLTIYETVQATNKTNDIADDRERKILLFERELAENPDYSYDMYEEDCHNAGKQAKWSIVRAWVPVITLGAASTASILGGYRIINGRYVATAAAYKVLENGFDRYRGNVIERFGKDVDWQLANDIKAEELAAAQKEREKNREIEADNKHRIIKKKPKTAYQDIYQCVFDEYSDRWQRYWTAEQVWAYLQTKENELNDMLKIRKHLFVNEVYDKLGLERTSEGQVTGWIITRNHDSHVSLGLKEMPEEEVRALLGTRRNEDLRVKIRLNPDGLIYNMIDHSNGLFTLQ